MHKFSTAFMQFFPVLFRVFITSLIDDRTFFLTEVNESANYELT